MFPKRVSPQRFGGVAGKPKKKNPKATKATRKTTKAAKKAVAKPAKAAKKAVAKPAKAKSRPAPDVWDKAAKVAAKRGAKARVGR